VKQNLRKKKKTRKRGDKYIDQKNKQKTAGKKRKKRGKQITIVDIYNIWKQFFSLRNGKK